MSRPMRSIAPRFPLPIVAPTMSETERLIELVKQRPLLFNSKHYDYKNRKMRVVAWQEISKAMGAGNANIWSAKWKGLKDNYSKFKKTSDPTFSQTYKKYKNWPWAEHVKFLDDCSSLDNKTVYPPPQESTAIRNIVFGTPINNNVNKEQTQDPKFCNVQLFIPEANLNGPMDNSLDPVPEGSENFIPESKKRRITDKTEPTDKPTLDGIDHFFLSYAQSFKQLPSRMQIMLKLEIATLFSRYELQAEGVTQDSVGNITRIVPYPVKYEHDFTNTVDDD